jgi:hypothetical protein
MHFDRPGCSRADNGLGVKIATVMTRALPLLILLADVLQVLAGEA